MAARGHNGESEVKNVKERVLSLACSVLLLACVNVACSLIPFYEYTDLCDLRLSLQTASSPCAC